MQKITRNGVLSGSVAFLAMCCVIQPAHAATPERNAYFGNTLDKPFYRRPKS